MIRMRQIQEHTGEMPNAWAFHQWAFTGQSVRADRTGRRNPRMVADNWLVVNCQNPYCIALAIINKDDLLGLLPPAPQSKPLGVAP